MAAGSADSAGFRTELYRFESIAAAALYEEDRNLPYRKSHDNPIIKEVYDNYFGKPGSHKAHEVLHTTYVKRGLYK